MKGGYNMCVILAVGKSAKFPTKNELNLCYMHNPDGAGFSYFDGRTTRFKKGYMTFEPFYADLLDVHQKYPTSQFLLHFRIATHGAFDATMTHPFPLTCTDSRLMSLSGKSDVVIAHNGIIPMYGKGQLSDTADYIKSVLYPLQTWKYNFFENEIMQGLIYNDIQSKLCIFHQNKFTFIGKFTLESGIYYSNTNHRTVYKYPVQQYSSAYSSYFDYDEYENDVLIEETFNVLEEGTAISFNNEIFPISKKTPYLILNNNTFAKLVSGQYVIASNIAYLKDAQGNFRTQFNSAFPVHTGKVCYTL